MQVDIQPAANAKLRTFIPLLKYEKEKYVCEGD
jgi:hypothetical protein